MYLDVLEKVNSGINKPTNIMYKCNLSWIPMKEILTALIERNLIKEIKRGNKRTYEITERGRNLLRYLENALDILESRRHRLIPISEAGMNSPILTRLNLQRRLSPTPQRSKPTKSSHS